ncbi:MAG: hypothetical protein C5B58_11795 [Acidobacteria bacterium]|nr:MAG: hypothetical protein C5B58_11795 [Acidobacteriota bacterium]
MEATTIPRLKRVLDMAESAARTTLSADTLRRLYGDHVKRIGLRKQGMLEETVDGIIDGSIQPKASMRRKLKTELRVGTGRRVAAR